MKCRLIWIGKNKQGYVESGIAFFLKRLKPHLQIELIELELPKKARTSDPILQKKREADLVLSRLSGTDVVVLFDENGRELSSRGFASFMREQMLDKAMNLVFVIGGSYGFDKSIYQRARHRISLSKMTYSHQIVRLVILEQLYRSVCILKGHPYHHD